MNDHKKNLFSFGEEAHSTLFFLYLVFSCIAIGRGAHETLCVSVQEHTLQLLLCVPTKAKRHFFTTRTPVFQ
jgi:hypothetical protein